MLVNYILERRTPPFNPGATANHHAPRNLYKGAVEALDLLNLLRGALGSDLLWNPFGFTKANHDLANKSFGLVRSQVLHSHLTQVIPSSQCLNVSVRVLGRRPGLRGRGI